MISQALPQHTQAEHQAPAGDLFSRWHFAALFLVIFALFVLRRPDSLANPQFWAEDGVLLFQGQLLRGSLAWIFEPYKGYLIVNTKLIAAFATLFPVIYAPLIYNVAAILIASIACSLFAMPWDRHLVRSDLLRTVVCLGVAGALYTESLVDNACNSQWYLALIGFLILFRASPPKEARWKALIFGVVAGLVALTNPVMVISIPICLWQLVTKRNRLVASVMLVGITVEISFFLFYPSSPITTPVRPGVLELAIAVGIATVYKVVISSFFGWRTALAVSNAGSSLSFFFISIAAAAWLMWLFACLKSAKRMQMGIALYLIAASVALPMSGRGEFRAFLTPTHILQPRGEQYFFIAGCALLFLIALTIERVMRPSWKYVQSAAFILALAGGFYENFRVPPFYDFQWPKHAPAIEAWSKSSRLGSPAGVSVPINPSSLFIRLPSLLRDITIAGFPDHVWARVMEGEGKPISIAPSFIHEARELEYIDLPLVLGTNTTYRVNAVLQSDGSSVVSLLVHSRLNHGPRVETPPTSVLDDTRIGTELRTDLSGRLCVHLRHISGAHASFRSITLLHL